MLHYSFISGKIGLCSVLVVLRFYTESHFYFVITIASNF